jgi:3-oxoacyl-[acyl-carrier-protein] synthase-1
MQTYIIADNIISPLGNTTLENFNSVIERRSGIELISNSLSDNNSTYASRMERMNADDDASLSPYTYFEKLCILSIRDALSKISLKGSEKETIFILSTTKGNIELIQNDTLISKEQVSLDLTAQVISSYFEAANKPIVISNACISGVLAIIMAKRLLESGNYQHAIVVGADVLSEFVLSGFKSLMAMSDEPCRPFDKDRKGVNLGEGAATVIMTTNKSWTDQNSVLVMGEGLTNDANHISGPSRTGQELADAVQKAMKRSNVGINDLSFISSHGTATIYNDEMESKAFDLVGLNEIPVHSLKGYFGHTLGAAGVIESIMTIQSLRKKCVLVSKNYEQLGTSKGLNVNMEQAHSDKHHALKTASGFGGCNAALVYSTV